jgi:hypothetical protein
MTQKILWFIAAGAYLLAILMMLKNGFGNTADRDVVCDYRQCRGHRYQLRVSIRSEPGSLAGAR